MQSGSKSGARAANIAAHARFQGKTVAEPWAPRAGQGSKASVLPFVAAAQA